MAEALLKAWNAPAVVSDVEIDAASMAVRKAINTSITAVSNDSGIAWTQVDNSLPMPIETFPSPELLRLALRSSDFMEALNRETLVVTGLAPGRAYAL